MTEPRVSDEQFHPNDSDTHRLRVSYEDLKRLCDSGPPDHVCRYPDGITGRMLALDLRDSRTRVVELEEALKEAERTLILIKEIQESDDVREIYTCAHVHGTVYRGPTWEVEMASVLARLSAVRGKP